MNKSDADEAEIICKNMLHITPQDYTSDATLVLASGQTNQPVWAIFICAFDLPNSISVAAHTWNWNFCLASWKRMIMFTLINFSHRLDIKKGMYPLWHNLVYLRPQCCYFGHHSAGEVPTERAVKRFWLSLDGKLHTQTQACLY